MKNELIPTIGIECHVQLKTDSKLFARVSNDAREANPNTTISPICFGLPGVLPMLNHQAVELAIRAGLALNAKIAEFSKFDRKHYFYPDLPKGYQITQYDQPIVGEGYLDVPVAGEIIRIGIERAHLEEDAGKSTHPPGSDYSLVDLNRAGTPLLEIVSKPEIHSASAAKAYARELYLTMKYAEVSDVDLFHGHMRFDVNISMAPAGKLGTRTEIKNLNSFRAVEKAATFEIERQTKLIEQGKSVTQETRGWDEAKQKTISQRSKEEAHDYRYFPDPDLPPIVLKRSEIERHEKQLPMLPEDFRKQLGELSLDSNTIEMLVDNPKNAEILKDHNDADYEQRVVFMARLISGPVQSLKNKKRDTDRITLSHLAELYDLRANNKLSSNGVDAVLEAITLNGGSAESIAKEKGLLQVSDEGAIEKIVQDVISANPKAAEDVRNGEIKAIGFLVGQVMKESKGQANPQIAQEVIKKQLGV